ncbi:MAG: bifunctional demethylmenaquinone methyltransferase/2-methoxy-6-polyprenyl-1,4-benzoquinol methylase UbiE [Nitrospirota bacterium]|nr:bifunctional demethylmenaquinone methyltransferase/2-methoxy-6-polyprenyl-1,4-benzoquinol methylase UbiE [Nitrospirota bacterium]
MANKEKLIELFSGIHKKYDLLNHVLSLNLDKQWRKILVDQVKPFHMIKILDVCTGTGDLAIEFASRNQEALIVGIDIVEQMLSVGLEKIKKANLDGRIVLQKSDLFHLPFKDGVFDAVSIGFGLRNLHDMRSGVREMARVLKKGGLLLILELTRPQSPFLKKMHNFYLNNMVPKVGGMISGSEYSYAYLSSSIFRFLKKDEVIELLEAENLKDITYKSLSGGIASIFSGEK